jgi:hypothetical protein
VPLVAATFFGANIDKTRLFLHEYGYVKKILGKSRLNRRIHAIEPTLWRVLFELLAQAFKERNADQTYVVVDSLPVAACDNIRIRRCRLYPPEESAGKRSEAMCPEQATLLLLRLAGVSGGQRGRRAGGVFFGSGFSRGRYQGVFKNLQ